MRSMPSPIGGLDGGERGADDPLIGPAGAPDHGDRAIGAVMRGQLGHDVGQRVDRQVDGERRAGGGEGGSVSPSGIGEARPAVRVRTTDCARPGSVSSAPSAAAAAAKEGTPGVTS